MDDEVFMKCAVCKFLFASLTLFLATISLNAQNLMNRVYTNTTLSDVNRGDFNEDGIPDVIYMTSEGVKVGLSNSQGSLTFLSSAGTISQGDGGNMAVAKFTSSGHLDVAVLKGNAGVAPNFIDIMLGHGDGTFEIGQPAKLPEGVTVGAMTASDFNGDGKVDLALFEFLGTHIYILTGRGDGTFDSAKVISTALSNGSDPIASGNIFVGDFDGDGRLDLLISDAKHAAVMFNNGNLSFQRKDVTNESAMIYDFGAADVNQDGFTDFIITLQGDCPPNNSPCNGGYAVYLSQGSSRTFKLSYRLAPVFNVYPPQRPIAVDVDGDGINDIVFITQSIASLWHMAKGNADGSFQMPTNFILSVNGGASGIVAVDLNRDGRPDFATTNRFSGESYTSLNAFPRPPCTPSTVSPLVTVCQPSDNTFAKSPLHIVAKATDTAHPVTAMQIYVDGQLKSTTQAASLDTTLPLPLGGHVLSVKAWDSSGKNFRSVRRVSIYTGTTGQVCSAGLNTMHLCAPAQNANVPSPVRVFAASGTEAVSTAMQVYIDHQLVFSDDHGDNFIDHLFTLKAGTHTLTVKGWDAGGQQLSQSETIHVTQNSLQ